MLFQKSCKLLADERAHVEERDHHHCHAQNTKRDLQMASNANELEMNKIIQCRDAPVHVCTKAEVLSPVHTKCLTHLSQVKWTSHIFSGLITWCGCVGSLKTKYTEGWGNFERLD